MQQQVKEINSFYSRFSVSNIDDETQIIRSQMSTYLVKLIKLEQDHANVDNVIETLEQHLTLNDQFLLTLKHYEIMSENSTIWIRSIYQYDQLTLKQEIQLRKQKLRYFHSQQIWMIVYAVTRGLQYLENLNIAYGVLDCDKIFLGEKIKLLDPSAIAEDPLLVTDNRLYSPEVLEEHQCIDILKSDVFIFGLCLLQTALLIQFSQDFLQNLDQTRLRIYLDNVQKLYEPEFSNMLRLMLQYNPEERPTFSQIRQFLERNLDMTNVIEENFYAPMNNDQQDEGSLLIPFEDTAQFENIDIQEEQSSPFKNNSLSEYQKAKIRFLNESRMSERSSQCISRISQQSRASSNMMNNNKTVKMQKKKVSKSIKDKLVKKMNSSQLQIVEIVQYKKGDDLFTNPKLMADIKNELKSIARNRQQGKSKQNISNNY